MNRTWCEWPCCDSAATHIRRRPSNSTLTGYRSTMLLDVDTVRLCWLHAHQQELCDNRSLSNRSARG